MLSQLIKIAHQHSETRSYLVPLIRRISATQSNWDLFLKEKYEGGKALVDNPNPKSRKTYPQVTLFTALKYETGGYQPVLEKVRREYQQWLHDSGIDTRSPTEVQEQLKEQVKALDPFDSKALRKMEKHIKELYRYPQYNGFAGVLYAIEDTKKLQKRINESISSGAPQPVFKTVGTPKFSKDDAKKIVEDMPDWIRGAVGNIPITTYDKKTWIKKLKKYGLGEGTAGIYSPEEHFIGVSGDPRKKEDYETAERDPAVDQREFKIRLLHELAHALDHGIIGDKDSIGWRISYISRRWRVYPGKDNHAITNYAKQDEVEDFAECFAWVQVHPDYARDTCPNKTKMIHRILSSYEIFIKAMWKRNLDTLK